MSDADVIVVGGGPAGASTAFALARSGVNVLVIDRERFPRDKACAEYLSPQASRVLSDMGVLAEIEARGPSHLAGMIVRTIASSGDRLDTELAEITTNWRLERLGAIERSVLRLAAAELEIGETPTRVVIQEAVRLAERYGSPESAKFVNGILDAYARKAGSLS